MKYRLANRFLPIEESEKRVYTEALIKHRKRYTETPIFDRLNCLDFWIEQLDGLTGTELRAKCIGLGLQVKSRDSTSSLKSKLVEYFMQRVEDMSRGNG